MKAQKPTAHVGVCIHGKFSRLELASKLKYIVESQPKSVEIDIVFSLTNTTRNTNDKSAPWKWFHNSGDELKSEILRSGASRVTLIREDIGKLLFRDSFVDRLDKSGSLQSRQDRHQTHLRQYWSVSKCADQLIEWEEEGGYFYDEIVKLRDDTIVLGHIPLGQGKFQGSIYFKNCAEWEGVNEKHFIGEGRYVLGLLRRLLLDYYRYNDRYFSENSDIFGHRGGRLLNIETFYLREPWQLRYPFKRVSPEILPFITGRLSEHYLKSVPECVPCQYFQNSGHPEVRWYQFDIRSRLKERKSSCNAWFQKTT